MSQVAERNFANFLLGDNVYELAGGVVVETAQLLGVDLGEEPNSAALGELVRRIGPNKVLRRNEEVTAIDLPGAVDLVKRSHIQDALSRSLWTPNITVAGDKRSGHEQASNALAPDRGVSTGAVPNWQDRTAKLWLNSGLGVPLHALAGTRIMDGPSDVNHPKVKQLRELFGRNPTEAEYAGSIIVPRLVRRGKRVLLTACPTDNGSEIADLFFAQNPGLLDQSLVVARVANAGIQLAVQFRNAARKLSRGYDSDPANPQLFVITDTLPLAEKRGQIANPKKYQSPFNALRQMALTAKLLHQATGGA